MEYEQKTKILRRELEEKQAELQLSQKLQKNSSNHLACQIS